MKKYLTELIGTFFLVLIIGLSKNPLAIGFGLTILVYMGAHISGAHYNPAVSLAMLLRKEINISDFIKYISSQVLGASLAAYVVSIMSSNMIVQPDLQEPVAIILLAELMFTYLLVFVILNVATHPNLEGNSFYGFAIGLTVMTGAYCVGPLTGGVFNPAVSIGPSLIDLVTGNGISQHFLWYYLTAPVAGSIIAVLHFNFIIKK
jgi:aquaporin Z|tara:strand:- start:371 stop:985 length:615 start_codon:yes stop_codon:yes gene_type:complete